MFGQGTGLPAPGARTRRGESACRARRRIPQFPPRPLNHRQARRSRVLRRARGRENMEGVGPYTTRSTRRAVLGQSRRFEGLAWPRRDNAGEAVKQWRFNPLPSISMESVDLYFNLVRRRIRRAPCSLYGNSGKPAGSTHRQAVLSHYTQPASAACPDGERTASSAYFHLDKKGVPSEVRSTPAARPFSDAVQVRGGLSPPRSDEVHGPPTPSSRSYATSCRPRLRLRRASVAESPSHPSSLEWNRSIRKLRVRPRPRERCKCNETVDTDGFCNQHPRDPPLGPGP
jgi:hypothetical protein